MLATFILDSHTGNEQTVTPTQPQIFLSYSGDDACEASLLQFALELDEIEAFDL